MIQQLLAHPVGRFRLIAFIEGISFLIILFITMPLKYLFQQPSPNMFFGMLHGILFVLYVLWAIQLKIEQQWSWAKLGLILIVSIIPFGTFWADKKLLQKEVA